MFLLTLTPGDVDDVLGHTKERSEHMKILRDFFERVKQVSLSLKPSNVALIK